MEFINNLLDKYEPLWNFLTPIVTMLITIITFIIKDKKASKNLQKQLEDNSNNINKTINANKEISREILKQELKKAKKYWELEYIVDKRINLLNENKIVLAKYIALSFRLANLKILSENEKELILQDNYSLKLNIYLAKLELFFNEYNPKEKVILDLIKDICNNLSEEKNDFNSYIFKEDISCLTKLSQIYFVIEEKKIYDEVFEKSTNLDKWEKIFDDILSKYHKNINGLEKQFKTI